MSDTVELHEIERDDIAPFTQAECSGIAFWQECSFIDNNWRTVILPDGTEHGESVRAIFDRVKGEHAWGGNTTEWDNDAVEANTGESWGAESTTNWGAEPIDFSTPTSGDELAGDDSLGVRFYKGVANLIGPLISDKEPESAPVDNGPRSHFGRDLSQTGWN